MEQPDVERRTLVLEMARAEGDAFGAYLECRRKTNAEGPPTLRLALFDISRIETG
jgi:hypothetical protein